MTEKELKAITKNIAISVAVLCQKLPANKVNNTYINQIPRSSASMGANYRAACRGKSSKDFVYKLQVVEEETDETMFFLELLAEFNEKQRPDMRVIYKDTETVLKIIVASIKTAQRNESRTNTQQPKIKNQKPKKNER
ncbi:MAG TPA: four helix bundle protein [Chitinophagaceae bacterium]|nr:four helix bundle protein [Chitinophagaceae bacterium]